MIFSDTSTLNSLKDYKGLYFLSNELHFDRTNFSKTTIHLNYVRIKLSSIIDYCP